MTEEQFIQDYNALIGNRRGAAGVALMNRLRSVTDKTSKDEMYRLIRLALVVIERDTAYLKKFGPLNDQLQTLIEDIVFDTSRAEIEND